MILTHCQLNKIKNMTVLLLKKTRKLIKLNGNGEEGVLTRKIDIKSLIINSQREQHYSIENNLVCMYLI